MPTQKIGEDNYTLYRHKRDHRVEYWAVGLLGLLDEEGHNVPLSVGIRATQNALHPEWDEVPLEYTVDGGVMDYEAFMELYQRVED